MGAGCGISAGNSRGGPGPGSRQAVQKVDRPVSRKIRDGAYLALIAVVLILALVGLVGGVTFLIGGISTGTQSANVSSANATATAIVQRASAQEDARLASARKQALAILAAAHAEAKRIRDHAKGHSGSQSGTTPTPIVVTSTPVASTSTPVPQPTPTPTPAIPGAPNLSNVPASYVIYVFDVVPSARSARIVNVSHGPLSGTLVITYLKANGHVIARKGAPFTNVPGRSVADVRMPPPPAHWTSIRISVTSVR